MPDYSGNSDEDGSVKARLKWFNGPKGFGFVVPDGHAGDAFLHVTTLQSAGVTALGEGALLICLIDAGPRGAQVRKVLQLIDAGSNPEPLKSAIEHGCPANSDKIAGAIKWYKPEKGFGFVIADNGGKDVFIHKTCLERHGLDTIETGKRLLMTIKTVAKGREVIDFELLDN